MRRHLPHPELNDPESAGLVAWRRRRLERAGFEAELAETMAADGRIDLHEVLELVERGCPPDLAARILAPLDADGERH